MFDFAHGVGRVYESPLPVWLYGLGAAVTVVLSFVLRAVVRGAPRTTVPRTLVGPRGAGIVIRVLRILAFGGLLLAFIAGIVVRDRGLSFAPLWFWIILIISTAVLSAIVEGVWAAKDPWATMERFYGLEGADADEGTGPPWWIGPVGLYLLFWFELVSGVGFEAVPVVIALLVYTLFHMTFRRAWGPPWREADPLSLLFGFCGACAPLEIDEQGLRYRGWLSRLESDDPVSKTAFASVFVLLGATTLDNIRETTAWHSFLESARVSDASPLIVDSVALLAFAGLFLAPYALAMLVTARSLRSADVRATTYAFARSLIPIGVAYLIAHNAPLLMTGMPRFIQYLSDPFERGWDLLGTAHLFGEYLPSPQLVWFMEIALIIGGHVLGVLAAHRIAFRLAGSHSVAVKSQVALTILMSFFTVTTLILLGQPLVA